MEDKNEFCSPNKYKMPELKCGYMPPVVENIKLKKEGGLLYVMVNDDEVWRPAELDIETRKLTWTY